MSADGDWKFLISIRALHNQIHSNAKCKNRIDNDQCFVHTNHKSVIKAPEMEKSPYFSCFEIPVICILVMKHET